MRKLSLDLGTKTCGFAITDSMQIIASALETIRFEENDFDKVIDHIKKYLAKYNDIDGFIIGIPLRSNGQKSERTILIENFAIKINDIFDQNVYLVNEYGTTIRAEKTLKSAKLNHKKVREIKDSLSAVIILQEFLQYGGKLVK